MLFHAITGAFQLLASLGRVDRALTLHLQVLPEGSVLSLSLPLEAIFLSINRFLAYMWVHFALSPICHCYMLYFVNLWIAVSLWLHSY